jgi:hypothetical protein
MTREFHGFDMDLSADLENISVHAPLKYQKMDSKVIKQKLVIVHRVHVVGENMQPVDVDVTNKPSPFFPSREMANL